MKGGFEPATLETQVEHSTTEPKPLLISHVKATFGWSWHIISELLMFFNGFPALYLVTISLVWGKCSHTRHNTAPTLVCRWHL